MWVDSSAAIGISSRKGHGRVRHLEVRELWHQEQVRAGRIQVQKVCGKHNPAAQH